MASMQKKGMLSNHIFDSRIKSANVQHSERWLGFFLGPSMAYTIFAIAGQTYLNMFYTDVLNMTPLMGGMFLVIMPLVSKILDAITNIIMGRIIDGTRSRQGIARPWILISAPLMVISGILLFAVPQTNDAVKMTWVTLSYNFFFCVSFTMYNISNTLMVPLSTRNNKQRDTLGMVSSMGRNMIPGTINSILFPMLFLPRMGVDQEKWLTVMSVICALLLPFVLIQYYYTKERVTEERMSMMDKKEESLRDQIKACFSSKYWVLIIIIYIIYSFYSNLGVISTAYYCNWVLGSYNDGTTMTLVNAVGQAPLGFGILALWPIVAKTGKRNVMFYGFGMAVLGSVICMLFPGNMGAVLGGLVLRSFGTLPITYLLLSMIADSLDHVEKVNHFRADGFSSSIVSIIVTVSSGLAAAVFNAGLSTNGYVAPLADGTWVAQNAGVQNFILIATFLIPMISYILISLLLIPYKVEQELPQIRADITAYNKAKAAERGEVYISSEEKAAMEQEENDRIAEEKRIKELKDKCARKGLNFEAEEAKYQAKLTEKQKKQEAKAARHKK